VAAILGASTGKKWVEPPPIQRNYLVTEQERGLIFKGLARAKQISGIEAQPHALWFGCLIYLEKPTGTACTHWGPVRWVRLWLYSDQVLAFEEALAVADCEDCASPGCALGCVFAGMLSTTCCA
jgi:hypothetical protein